VIHIPSHLFFLEVVVGVEDDLFQILPGKEFGNNKTVPSMRPFIASTCFHLAIHLAIHFLVTFSFASQGHRPSGRRAGGVQGPKQEVEPTHFHFSISNQETVI